MPRLREFFVTFLALPAATVALAVPTHSQTANASLPVSQVIIWGDSMSLNWYAYLQPLLNVPVIPNGEGSTDVQQIEAKFNNWINTASPTERATTGHICWCGGVNANIYHEGDPNTDLRSVVPVMQRMQARLPDSRLFEPMSLSNMPEAARGTEGYGIAIDDGNPNTFTATNEQMAVAFGNAYAEVRSYMVTNGLADAGLPQTAADTTNIQQDVVPQSLRQNPTDPHLNDAGKQVVAGRMNALLRADGWVPPETRTATTTTAASSGSPSASGTPVQVTATVRNATAQGGQPTGTVQFIVDAKPLLPKVMLNSSGVAVSQQIRNLAVGTHTISAVYSGNSTFKSSNVTITQVVTGTVTKLSTATAAVSNPSSPTAFGVRFRVNAQVTNNSGQPGAVPTGTVQFKIDGRNAGLPVTLSASGSAASIQSSATLARGNHTITVTYSGSTTYESSTFSYVHVVT